MTNQVFSIEPKDNETLASIVLGDKKFTASNGETINLVGDSVMFHDRIVGGVFGGAVFKVLGGIVNQKVDR